MSLEKVSAGDSLNQVPALIVEKKVAVAKNGKSYADLTVRDSNGSLKCKIWSFVDQDWIATGKVVYISGDIGAYQGEMQLTVSSILPNTVNKPEEFAKKSRFHIDTMMQKIQDVISKMEDPLTKYVSEYLINETLADFKRAPAATGMHNAWVGGLLEHVWSMCRMAKPIVEHYNTAYESPINSDKVMFGVIFHDLGKIREYDVSNPAFPHTPEGLLVNHLVTGPALIYEACNKWRDSAARKDMDTTTFELERAHLMHLVAAHHGTNEWGSPVQPVTLEAILVHQLDLIDSRFMHAFELAGGKEGQIPGFSEKSWSTKTSYMKYNREA